MAWTNRTKPAEDVSPDINDVSSVINTLTTEVLNAWRPTESWTKRTSPTTVYSVEDGLWIEHYLPWTATALPWQRTIKSTNWTKRS